MKQKENMTLLEQLFATMTYAITLTPGAQHWLEERGLDYKELEVGYNSGQFHHRKPETFRQQYAKIGILTQTKSPFQQEGGAPAYKCFAAEGIVFPMKDKHGKVVNLHGTRFRLRIPEAAYLYSDTGLYPSYPKATSKRLYITSNILDAASLLQSKLLEKTDAVLALENGNVTKELIAAIAELKQLKEIVVIKRQYEGIPTEQLQQAAAGASLLFAFLPEEHSLNDMWVNYGREGIHKLLSEAQNNESQQEATKVAAANYTAFETHEIDDPAAEVAATKTGLHVFGPQKISYEGEAGTYYVLGNIPMDMGTMQVMLCLETSDTGKKERMRINLYSKEEIHKWSEELSEREGFDQGELEDDLATLTDELETYREKLVEEQYPSQQRQRETPVMSPQQEREAITFLQGKNLLKKVDKLIEQSGVVGEDKKRMLVFLAGLSYKMPDPLHLLVQGSTGSGKTHLISGVASCFPKEDKIEVTRITPKSLFNYSDDSLINKLFVIHDYDGLSPEAEYSLRELQSARSIASSTTVKDRFGNLQSYIRTVQAHFASFSATTKAEIYADNMSRSIVIGVDESAEQTERIIRYHNLKIAGLIDKVDEDSARQILSNCIRVLHPYQTVNHYADKIMLPPEARSLRRLNSQFQSFIAQVTLLHQYQRRKDKQGRLVTEPEDIRMALDIFLEAILVKADELDSSTRQFYEELKTHVRKQSGRHSFSQREVREALHLSKTQCFRFFEELLRLEHIKVVSGTANRGYAYQLANADNWEKLKTSIKTILNEQINQIK